MKWIGQNIYDQVSRFRNIVFFEETVEFNTDTITFQSGNADDPIVTIKNTSNAANDMASLNFVKERDGGTAAAGDNLAEIYFSGKDASGNTQEYGRILSEVDVATHGQESGRLKLGVANHDGTNGYGLTMQGGSVSTEVDVTVGLGASSVTDVQGTLSMGGTATINNSGVIQVAAQTVIDHDQLANFAASEHYVQESITTVGTIGTGVWNGTALATAYIADDAVTFAKATGVTSNVFGNTIKLLPSDFAANIDGGNTKLGVGYTDTAGSAYGMKVGSANAELFAFVSIPEGMTATHVDVFDKDDRALEVFEVQINATSLTSKGSGNCNTTLDITNVDATATNFLAIKITTTATTDKVFGGKVTIAPQ